MNATDTEVDVEPLRSVPPAASRLAARLRSLRTQRWSGRPVLQADLKGALNIGVSSLSSWESTDRPRLPTEKRIFQLATFYATRRSLDPPRLLPDHDLTADELAERDRLYAELRGLRALALSAATPVPSTAPRGLWHFPDGAPVRIICGALDEKDRAPFASGSNHNYMALSAYADADALVELFGHVRAENPDSDVRWGLARRLEDEDLGAHLVILGNMAWTGQGGLLREGDLPVRQVHEDGLDGEVFQVDEGGSPRRFGPTFVADDPAGVVIEDVGLLVRTASPVNGARTLTICSGVFTRGVYGAVRTLTDRQLRDDNLTCLRTRFPAAEGFGLLMRVAVHDHATGTPNLTDEKTRLFEFPLP